jgi:hypothetical protein
MKKWKSNFTPGDRSLPQFLAHEFIGSSDNAGIQGLPISSIHAAFASSSAPGV